MTRISPKHLKFKEDADMNPGARVLVPTTVKAGAFPGERLVTVQTNAGPVSGFTKSDYVIEKADGQFLLGEVEKVTGEAATVRLFGSFFTTTGVAEVPMATLRLKAAG
ncbi:MAG: hypothetical protein WD688_01705 [Candidatus Binatia bacterium]